MKTVDVYYNVAQGRCYNIDGQYVSTTQTLYRGQRYKAESDDDAKKIVSATLRDGISRNDGNIIPPGQITRICVMDGWMD